MKFFVSSIAVYHYNYKGNNKEDGKNQLSGCEHFIINLESKSTFFLTELLTIGALKSLILNLK